MVFSPITFIGVNSRRLKFRHFYGFLCDGVSEDVLCHIFFMLYKTKFLISHRPGQGHYKDSSLVFSDKYFFDFPLARWKKKKKKKKKEKEKEKKKKNKMEKRAFLQYTRKLWKLQLML